MILILTDSDPDYGPDYLTHGFCSLLGAENVVDWPRKRGLHWKEDALFDCHVDLDTAVMSQDEVHSALRDRTFNLIFIPTLRGTVSHQLYYQREMWKLNADRIVYYDAEDHAMDTRPLFFQMAGIEPAAYFKRELPIGETWATPLPFGYPAERVVTKREGRQFSFVYTAHLWEWCGTESLRRKLYVALRRELGAITNPDVHGRDRVSVKVNHQYNRQALIAVSPAGQGYGTNRHLEIIADGCAPVIERPWRQWPNAPEHWGECLYFKEEIECVEHVRELLNEPQRATEMAKAAQACLLRHHTTKHRADQVWRSIHNARTTYVAE